MWANTSVPGDTKHISICAGVINQLCDLALQLATIHLHESGTKMLLSCSRALSKCAFQFIAA